MRAFILLAIIFFVLPVEAYAIAVGSPFLEENTLKIPEGTSTTYTITLQNIGSSDVEVKVVVGGGIANIADEKEVYLVPAGKTDFPITFNIIPPKDARPGDIYTVDYTIKSANSGDAFPVSLRVTKSFKVEIIKNPDKLYFGSRPIESGVLWLGAFALLLIYVLYKQYKQNESKKKKRKR